MDMDNNMLLQSIIQNIYDSDSSSSSSNVSTSTSSSSDLRIDTEPEQNKHHKVSDFLITIQRYSDTDFKRHFRLSRTTANIVIDEYKSSDVCPKYKSGRANVGGEKETYIFLWYVANSITYRQLGNLFDVSNKTAWSIVNRVSSWIVYIADKFIKWPRTQDKVQQITAVFERMKGISGVIGAIDGTHIKIKPPSNKIPLYSNRKKYCSIVMQAVVDSQKKFLDVHCGEPGSFHDSRVLRRSILYRKATEEYSASFPNNTFLIGDCAYGSRSWLVTPFKDTGNLTDEQRKFNYILSATRMVVENAFGLLKTRFRRLLHFTEHNNINTVINVTIACCALHNLCIDECDYWNYDEESIEGDVPATEEHEIRINNLQDRRAAVFNDLLEKGVL